jgi:hypothetical protein
VDDPASRPPRSRTWTGGGTCGLADLAQGTVCKILGQEEVKPHKVRYYLEQRDPDFAEKMAEVLCVYRQVKILKQAAPVSKEKKKPSDAVALRANGYTWLPEKKAPKEGGRSRGLNLQGGGSVGAWG